MIYHKRHFGSACLTVPYRQLPFGPEEAAVGNSGLPTDITPRLVTAKRGDEGGREGERESGRTAEYFIPATIFVADFVSPPVSSDDKRVCAFGKKKKKRRES